jgi:hypothetical protein
METATVSKARKMSLREPIRPAQWALTRTEARYPRKFAVLMNPIWEYERRRDAAIEGSSIPRAKRPKPRHARMQSIPAKTIAHP